jgi:L-ribulose-5-phosphate 3-epimerase
MRKSITLRAFPAEMNTRRRVELACDAGFEGVEVNLEPDQEYTLESTESELIALRRYIETQGMQVSSVYNRQQWLYPITSQNQKTRKRGQAIIEDLVRIASILGTDAVLVVPGAVDNSLFAAQPEIVPYEIAYRNAQNILREIAYKLGEQYQVYLAIENVWNKFLLSPLELARFVDEVESPWVGVYFDVGNVLRTGFPEHWISILGQRIKRIHFKDFRLAVDNLGGFVTLLEGDVNWPAVRAALSAIQYSSWVTAEVLPAFRYHGERLIYETSASLDAILGK